MKKLCRPLNGCSFALVLLLLVCGCSQGDERNVLFRDDFDQPRSGWGTDQRYRFERGYWEGEYFIALLQPNWFTWAYPGQRFADVSVEVDVYLGSGPEEGHFGVLCRHVDPGNFYYFAVSPDGFYGIFRRVDGGGLEVLTGGGSGMVFSPAIRTGGQTNHVLAICQGDELTLYANGELLETIADDTFARGDVGIGAASGPAGDVLVQFDNFLVTRP